MTGQLISTVVKHLKTFYVLALSRWIYDSNLLKGDAQGEVKSKLRKGASLRRSLYWFILH